MIWLKTMDKEASNAMEEVVDGCFGMMWVCSEL